MSASYGIRPGQHVTGEVMHDYLVAYAREWDIAKRITFNTVVSMIEKQESGHWKVTIRTAGDDSGEGDTIESELLTSKLVVATGLTNEPHRPRMDGTNDFDGPVIHSADLGRAQSSILDLKVRTVAVVGGGKSAYDAVYLAALAGKRVEWIIRRSGKGPTWVFPAKAQLGPFKALREVRMSGSLISPPTDACARNLSCVELYLYSVPGYGAKVTASHS